MSEWLRDLLLHPALLVGLGGAVGSNARFWLGVWIKSFVWAEHFFWGTLMINVTGSILLGLVAVLWKDARSPGFLLLGTGFCGGYTTFSTFSLETLRLLERGQWLAALAYVLVSVLAGFFGLALVVWLGGRLGEP